MDDQGHTQNRVIHTCIRPSDMENADVDMHDLLRKAMRFSPDIIAVAEMRGAEAMTAQEAARTGHVVVTSLHANSASKAYGRILSMCQMSGTQYIHEHPHGLCGRGISGYGVQNRCRTVRAVSWRSWKPRA